MRATAMGKASFKVDALLSKRTWLASTYKLARDLSTIDSNPPSVSPRTNFAASEKLVRFELSLFSNSHEINRTTVVIKNLHACKSSISTGKGYKCNIVEIPTKYIFKHSVSITPQIISIGTTDGVCIMHDRLLTYSVRTCPYRICALFRRIRYFCSC
ncbi:hypothetical protein BDN67DRAFT_372777 [Paxillus ammoniavirescens]|nr:hypothetical protein BDN67DRAFT_372777 [Paxillus ammoniavirescens]